MADSQRRNSPPNYYNGQDIRHRTFDFACRVAKLCKKLYDEGGVSRMMVPQLLNCSTSTAANLEEARAAESDADFISKCCISLKECRESWARLRVCKASGLGPALETKALVQEASELIAIVTTIIRNKRRTAAAGAVRRGRSRIRILNS